MPLSIVNYKKCEHKCFCIIKLLIFLKIISYLLNSLISFVHLVNLKCNILLYSFCLFTSASFLEMFCNLWVNMYSVTYFRFCFSFDKQKFYLISLTSRMWNIGNFFKESLKFVWLLFQFSLHVNWFHHLL